MITEDYVSFETAKLLKEKGFTGNEIHKYYDISDEKPILYSESYIHEFDKDFWMKDLIMAPTLQMAMKWFLKKYNIFICILFLEEYNGFGYTIENTLKKKYIATSENSSYKEPEEACEAAIKYCLEKLI